MHPVVIIQNIMEALPMSARLDVLISDFNAVEGLNDAFSQWRIDLVHDRVEKALKWGFELDLIIVAGGEYEEGPPERFQIHKIDKPVTF